MIVAHNFWFQQPVYDPLVADQEHFDPVTLMPVFPPPVSDKLQGPLNVVPATLPTGINFYIPPPEMAQQPDVTQPEPPQSSTKDYWFYVAGIGTIFLLFIIWFIIHKKAKTNG